MLTEAQAAYWINSGTIGPIPLDMVKGNLRNMLHQLSGGRITNDAGKKTPLSATQRRTLIRWLAL